MFLTSQKYKDTVNADIRKTNAEVVMNITSIVENEVTDYSLEFEISDVGQVVNSKYVGNYNLATYEKDRVRLDGSFRFADTLKENNMEVGFIGEEVCSIDKTFINNPYIKIEKTGDMNLFGCSIFFDNLQNEYAEDFNIEVYNGIILLKTIEIRNNKDIEFTAFDSGIAVFDSMVVEIIKWSKPEHRARIIEAECGVVKIYNDNNLVSVKMIEEMDFEGDQIMVPEIEIKILDMDREYDFLNPTGIYKYLNTNLNLTAQIGLELSEGVYENISLGKYKLSEWKKTTGSTTTILTGNHIINNLTKYTITESSIGNFYDLIENIFIVCGITEYSIDSILLTKSTFGKHSKLNARELLQYALVASCSRLYIDRQGTVNIVCNLTETKTNDISLDKAIKQPEVEMENPTKSIIVEVFTDIVDFKNITEIQEDITEDGKVIEIRGNTLINTIIQANEIVNYWISLSDYRATSSVPWRGDVSVELADKVGVETSFGIHEGYVVQNEIEYAGFLRESSKIKQKINI